MGSVLEVEDLGKHYARGQSALQDVTFAVEAGEILTVLGPSGCGKTTLLRLIAGFEVPDCGVIRFGGRVVAQRGSVLPAEERGIGMVFQDFALFPHLSVAQNIGFGLRPSAPKRVDELLELIGLLPERDRFIHQISGGQQQRVALARALAPAPALVLLDEPFSNLDLSERLRLREEVKNILKQTATAAIFVTHDCSEALSLGDRVAVIDHGQIQQWDTPEQVYRAPRNRFVAQFIGRANFLEARRTATGWQTELGDLDLDYRGPLAQLDLAVYPESVRLVCDECGPVEVRDRSFLGRDYHYKLRFPSGRVWQAQIPQNETFSIGQRVRIVLPKEQFVVLGSH